MGVDRLIYIRVTLKLPNRKIYITTCRELSYILFNSLYFMKAKSLLL